MTILSHSQYEKVHTGSTIVTKRLQGILEENGIKSILQDDTESARLAGYALGSPDNTRLLVAKDDLMKAKHIVTNSLNEFDTNALTDDELNTLATETNTTANVSASEDSKDEHKDSPEISNGRAFFYVAFMVYSIWRLSPLIRGEELSTFRIVISGGLIVFCIVMLIRFFKNKFA